MTICPRRAAAALALLLSLCLALPPAMAEEVPPPGPAPEASGALPSDVPTDLHLPPSETPPGGGVPEDGVGGAPAEEDTVSDWGELRAWLLDNRLVGGTVRLTNDITMDGMFGYLANLGPNTGKLRPVTVDCGEHTIYVQGVLELDCINESLTHLLTFTDDGAEEGLLRVLPGGTLNAYYITLDAGSEASVALSQEEGGVLNTDPARLALTGTIAYGERPTIFCEVPPLFVPALAVPDGEAPDLAALPATVEVQVKFQGVTETQEVAVLWDTAPAAEAFAQRRRVTLQGRFTGEVTVDGETFAAEDCAAAVTPECVVAFREGGAALLNLEFQVGTSTSGMTSMVGYVYYIADPGATAVRALFSEDEGKTWRVEWEFQEKKNQFLTVESAPFQPGSWFLLELVYPDPASPGGERLVHTDTVRIDEDNTSPMTWVDGHRGGGEPILPPPEPSGGHDDDDHEDDDRPVSTPKPTAAPRPSPTPKPTPGPTPTPAPVPTPTPEPSVSPTPEPVPTPEPSPSQAPPESPEAAVTPEPYVPAAAVSPAPSKPVEPVDTPIVTQTAEPVQPTPGPTAEPSPSPSPPPAEETEAPVPTPPPQTAEGAPVLPPVAQIALGIAAIAAVTGGAAALLNPGAARALWRRLRRGRK